MSEVKVGDFVRTYFTSRGIPDEPDCTDFTIGEVEKVVKLEPNRIWLQNIDGRVSESLIKNPSYVDTKWHKRFEPVGIIEKIYCIIMWKWYLSE